MHLINTSKVIHVEWPESGPSVEFQEEHIELVARNRLAVIEAGLAIEGVISRILGDFFIPATIREGEAQGEHFKRELFQLLILDSDGCSFAAKLKILISLVHTFDIFTGKEIEAFRSIIQKVMGHRNAFAHGHVKFPLDESLPVLYFFKDKPKREVLSDEHLKKIETDLDSGFAELYRLEKLMRERQLLPAN